MTLRPIQIWRPVNLFKSWNGWDMENVVTSQANFLSLTEKSTLRNVNTAIRCIAVQRRLLSHIPLRLFVHSPLVITNH
jgi:hypothetical protein